MSRTRRRFRIVGMNIHVVPALDEAIKNETIDKLIPGLVGNGKWIPLEMVPDPVNTNDRNAVRVIIPPHATGGEEYMLGYVPRDQAAAMAFLIGHCESRGCILGAGLRVKGLSHPHQGNVWSGELETTGPADAFKASRRPASDIDILFANQFSDQGAAAQSTPLRPRRGKVRHIWI